MKQSFLPLVALLMAVSFSSFRLPATSKPLTTYYWFQVNSGKGNEIQFDNSEVSFIQASTTPPSGLCSGTATYKCIVGFSDTQVDVNDEQLQPGNHTPAQMGQRRSNL